MASHQEREHNEMCAARPCIYRDPLVIESKHHPATPCCKASDQVLSARFYCTLLNKYLDFNSNICWMCKVRKETNP